MKISEVIKRLQTLQDAVGDLPMYTTDDHSLYNKPYSPVVAIEIVDNKVILSDGIAKL